MMRRKVLPAIGCLMASLGLFLLYRIFSNQDFAALARAILSASRGNIAIAFACTLGSFTAIAGLEYLAVRHVDGPITWKRIMATSTAAIGIGHVVGMSALSSGAIRYRMYSRTGVGIAFTGKVIVFSALSASCGFAGVGGMVLLWEAGNLGPVLDISEDFISALGIGVLALLSGYLMLCILSHNRLIRIWRDIHLRLPGGGVAALQIAFANFNVLCICGALYACVSNFVDTVFPTAASVYVSSDLTSLLAHVPGGWGVLEYVATLVLSEQALAGVILFRAIYYIVPLVIGLIILIGDEILPHRAADVPSVHPITNAT